MNLPPITIENAINYIGVTAFGSIIIAYMVTALLIYIIFVRYNFPGSLLFVLFAILFLPIVAIAPIFQTIYFVIIILSGAAFLIGIISLAKGG